jgi:hypothetical protein
MPRRVRQEAIPLLECRPAVPVVGVPTLQRQSRPLAPAVQLAITAHLELSTQFFVSLAHTHLRVRPIAPPAPPVSSVLRLAHRLLCLAPPATFQPALTLLSVRNACQAPTHRKQTPQLARPVPLAQLVQTLDKSIHPLAQLATLLLPRP